MTGATKPIPHGYHAVTPYLMVTGASGAITFYKKAFGARERMRIEAPGGKIGHAELQIGDSVIMLADEVPDMGHKSPRSIGGSPVTIHLYVDDVDRTAAEAEAAGAKITRPVQNQFYGDRTGVLEDPYGHVWSIATHVEDVPEDELRRRAHEAMKTMQHGQPGD